MSEGQRTGQRVHTPDISRIGRVCAWFMRDVPPTSYALVEMEDDGTFMLVEATDLYLVQDRVPVSVINW